MMKFEKSAIVGWGVLFKVDTDSIIQQWSEQATSTLNNSICISPSTTIAQITVGTFDRRLGGCFLGASGLGCC